MLMEVQAINKIISEYLSHDHVHNGLRVKEIKNETISTYDGLYPSFEIIYEGEQPLSNITQLEIIQGIEKYIGLKKNRDFWIGVSWDKE